jgi:hypothetical protein
MCGRGWRHWWSRGDVVLLEHVWTALDAAARGAKRSVFAESKRGWKIARERARNSRSAAGHLFAKLLRRADHLRRRAGRRVHRVEEARRHLDTYRTEWGVEREIARLSRGAGPIIVGPWLSEVGYEVLYWVPFVRWIQAKYDIAPDRMIVVTRGGASVWYRDVAERSVEIFDLMTPEAYALGNARRAAEGTGTLKQWSVSPMDRDIIDRVIQKMGVRTAAVLHPSMLYRLFQQFWLGHRPQAFLDRRTRYGRIAPPQVDVPPLPEEFVAVKFYTAASLPPSDAVRRTLRSMVLALAVRTPVVMLETGLGLDDHEDYDLGLAARIHTVKDALRPADNLAVQTAVIARAKAFVGTCGSLAWLAPMLGVDTTAILTDARFLHGHLHVARRVFQTLGGGRFTALDLSGFDQLGLSIAPRSAWVAGKEP